MSTVAGAGPGTQAERESDPPVSVKREWCKACGICVEFCPKKVFDSDEEGRPIISHPEACSLCRICEQLCPDFAARVRREDRAQRN
jgi:2-oxoglutarate ferredoxin oxidoreductase subunit delta